VKRKRISHSILFGRIVTAQFSLMVFFLFATSPAAGEMQTLTATGEYRVTDKDSRGEAERRQP
jgi:hypothetical protein